MRITVFTMNDGASETVHPLETRAGLDDANTSYLLKAALADLATAERRLARMRIAMKAAAALLAEAAGDR